MRLSGLGRTAVWRFAATPLVVWLVLTLAGATGLSLLERNGRETLAQRFDLRVQLVAEFVTSYVTDLLERERVQAEAFLTEPVVDERDFLRSVNAFGYPAALLLDEQGVVLHVAPTNPGLVGRRLADNYPHLRVAAVEGRPAVSPVVPSAAEGVPVVGFAVPFQTPQGRRVFSGAVQIKKSPLGSYLASAISIDGVRLQLVDETGVIVAANQDHPGSLPMLNTQDADLAHALSLAEHGRYAHAGESWHYASHTIPGTPWRLSAAVEEDVLYAPVSGNEIGGRAALVAAAAVGLLVVAVAGRARGNRRELQISEERFRRVFDNSASGMMLADPQGRMLRVNVALCQMLGLSEESLLGRLYTTFTHPDDRERCEAEIRACLEERNDGFTVEKRYLHADGYTVLVSVTAILLRDEHHRPQYFAVQATDVTARRSLERARVQHEAELAERADQLQQANNQMGDFIAMLTHDVRQPLTGVVSRGEMLLEGWKDMDDEVKQRYVHRMTAAGHRADHIVTEILTLAQLDAGAIAARPVRLDLHDAVRQAVNASETVLTVTAPDEALAFADPVHLQLMLGNLISNAVKYGKPPFEISVVRFLRTVEIRVSDHGEGVPEEFVPHLFDRFTRAGTGIATAKPGTGLGLHFVRQLADASGIAVSYLPREPHGSVFVLTVPAGPPPPQNGRRATGVPRDTAPAVGGHSRK
ncbi:PAS domain S-box protein [Actinoplanes sp. GCM10030250]|uniref:sensor histidine kinase n=1 Tax=Actinoplanes sp. GCM10030250 TaxID=3273376 RepID=UPI003606B444